MFGLGTVLPSLQKETYFCYRAITVSPVFAKSMVVVSSFGTLALTGGVILRIMVPELVETTYSLFAASVACLISVIGLSTLQYTKYRKFVAECERHQHLLTERIDLLKEQELCLARLNRKLEAIGIPKAFEEDPLLYDENAKIQQLPNELLAEIFTFVKEEKDLCNVSLVCKKWRRIYCNFFLQSLTKEISAKNTAQMKAVEENLKINSEKYLSNEFFATRLKDFINSEAL